MARSKSSGRWLQEHFKDEFVQRSKKDGYRSRAVYKLQEMNEKDRLLRPGMRVVELGAAPGGWSQYIVEHLGDSGFLVASDILSMDSFSNVEFVQGDFTEESVLNEILSRLGSAKADLVISDMAPNMSGVVGVDQPKSMYLAELARDLALEVLNPKGTFLVKLFHGSGFEEYIRELRTNFASVRTRKPEASRARSKEVYAVARNLKL